MNPEKARRAILGCTRCELSSRPGIRPVPWSGSLESRVLILGEAPGECISGDTFIDVAYRDKSQFPHGIPIRDLVGTTDLSVYSYDLTLDRLAVGQVRKVWSTGRRVLYRVTYYWWGGRTGGSGGRQKYFGHIDVTANHQFLVKQRGYGPSQSLGYRSIAEGLASGDRVQPFYRMMGSGYGYVGTGRATTRQKEARLLLAHKLDRKLSPDEEVHHLDRNKLNDAWDNIVLMTKADHARLHAIEDNVMFDPVHRRKHKQAVQSASYRKRHRTIMQRIFNDPTMLAKRHEQNQRVAHKTSATVQKMFDTDPSYYYHYLCGRKVYSDDEMREKMAARFPDAEYPPEANHIVLSIERIGTQPVYDMQVEPHHNFAANGIFVHNSENATGAPFVDAGASGHLLRKTLLANELSPKRCMIANTVSCLPGGTPTVEQQKACRVHLRAQLMLSQASYVLVLGAVALRYFDEDTKISARRGRTWEDGGRLYMATWHPAAALRNPEWADSFGRDIAKFARLVRAGDYG